jgi:aminopeptidase N
LPDSGDNSYTVTHYDLTLTYAVSSNRLSGRARLDCVAVQMLSRFALDLAGLRATKVTVDGRRPKRFAARGRRLLVWLDRPVDAAFRVEVTYGGNPRPVRGRWGDVGWEELTEGVLVAGQPDGAASWFPVNDRPAAKASYRINLTTDSPYVALANGSLWSRKSGAGQTTWVYDQPEPMASYLASVQIGRYGVTDLGSDPIPQAVFAPPRLGARVAADFGRHRELMSTFVDLFGPYPFESYRIVVTDDPLEIPLVAQGMSIFGANHVDGRGGYDRLIAHELAHQWFGNSVTASTWRDIWLHEGFACYAEWLWSQASGSTSVKQLAARHHLRLSMSAQDLVLADPGPERMFDDRVYKRGALTLHALRLTVGDEPFFGLLRRWTSEHRHGSVDTADFLALAASVARRPLDDLFDAWLFRTELPARPTAPSRLRR